MDQPKLKLPPDLHSVLRCPGRPDLPLKLEGNALVAQDGQTQLKFPVIDGTPVLINEKNSVFTLDDFQLGGGVTTMDLREESVRLDTPAKRLKDFMLGLIPEKSRHVSKFSASEALKRILADQPDARVLVVGAGDTRFGTDADANLVYTDVALAPDTQLIADCHDIPFANGTFDAVFAIAVLEHVADPLRCVAEMQRVLVPGGLVYATTPFMQQVHMGCYDFTRFTSIGHRRLFRWFDQIDSGVVNGPGMVVTWSLEYFLSTFSEKPGPRRVLCIVSRFLGWPFLLFDGILGHKRGANDCASAFYFFGRLRNTPISDREIVKSYRGLN